MQGTGRRHLLQIIPVYFAEYWLRLHGQILPNRNLLQIAFGVTDASKVWW